MVKVYEDETRRPSDTGVLDLKKFKQGNARVPGSFVRSCAYFKKSLDAKIKLRRAGALLKPTSTSSIHSQWLSLPVRIYPMRHSTISVEFKSLAA